MGIRPRGLLKGKEKLASSIFYRRGKLTKTERSEMHIRLIGFGTVVTVTDSLRRLSWEAIRRRLPRFLLRARACRGSARLTQGRVPQEQAALTIARLPALNASGGRASPSRAVRASGRLSPLGFGVWVFLVSIRVTRLIRRTHPETTLHRVDVVPGRPLPAARRRRRAARRPRRL